MDNHASGSKGNEWDLAGLLGHFGHVLTSLVDRHLGSDWAENDEILALLALRHDMGPTTRELACLSGLNRRAVSRLVGRLRGDGIVTTVNSPLDRRSVVIEVTPHGRRCFAALEADVASMFTAHRRTAEQICVLLHWGQGSVVTQREPLGLLEQLVQAGAELVDAVDSVAAASSMSGSQRTALVRIASRPDGLRPVDLVSTLGFGRSGVAYVVDQLCDKGLVTRSRDVIADDARAVVLQVTPEGLSAARSVSRAAAAHRMRLGPLFAAVRDWQ